MWRKYAPPQNGVAQGAGRGARGAGRGEMWRKYAPPQNGVAHGAGCVVRGDVAQVCATTERRGAWRVARGMQCVGGGKFKVQIEIHEKSRLKPMQKAD
jgi:hypothetical protein